MEGLILTIVDYRRSFGYAVMVVVKAMRSTSETSRRRNGDSPVLTIAVTSLMR